jgi:hypothetical protein
VGAGGCGGGGCMGVGGRGERGGENNPGAWVTIEKIPQSGICPAPVCIRDIWPLIS